MKADYLIDQQTFFKVQSVLKFYSAPKETFLDFWMTFFNPQNMPTVPRSQMIADLELLARGCFTKEPTLISTTFANGFYKMLQDRGCWNEEEDGIDMTAFKEMVSNNQKDLEYLNQCLMSDSEFNMAD